MAVCCTKEKSGEKIVYRPPDESVLIKKSNLLVAQFEKYGKAVGLLPEEVLIQREILPRVIVRVDKREGYFTVFHEGTQINEIKQAALTAYWILQLRPFMVDTKDPERMHEFARINEGFAAFYIFSACKQFAKKNGSKSKKASPRLKRELMYAFSYWDLSKEAIILIAETIGEAFYGAPAQGIDEDGCIKSDS